VKYFKKLTSSVWFNILLFTGVVLMAYQNCAQNYTMSIVKTPPSSNVSILTPPVPPAVQPVGQAAIYGQVVNAINNAAISGVLVNILNSTTGAVVAQGTTDTLGNYTISNIALGTYSAQFSIGGFSTYSISSPGAVVGGKSYNVNAALSPSMPTGQVRIVLSWTAQKTGAVRDVDSYLLEPGTAANAPVYWFSRNGAYSNLDVDQTQWVGPETVTITNLAAVGTFTYYIANWSDPSIAAALGNSNVVVTVYNSSGLIKQYHVPPYTGATGLVYELFTINNSVITDILAYDQPLYHCYLTDPVTGAGKCL
jgi:hypothetical protein